MNEHTKDETVLAEDASDIEAFEVREKEPDYALLAAVLVSHI